MVDTPNLISDLHATLGKLELALDAISEAIAWTGKDGIVQWCNTPLARLAGRQRLSVLGAPLLDLLPLKQQDQALSKESHPISLVLGTGSPITETYGLQRGPERLYLEIFGSRVTMVAV